MNLCLTIDEIAYTILLIEIMEPSTSQKQLVHSIAANCISVRLRLMNRLIGAIYDEALRPHGIKSSQLNILVAVAAFGNVTSQQICQMLHMDTSTFSRALARLKKKQWLQVESSGDGKILIIQITEEGFDKIEKTYPDWQRAQAKALDLMGESASDAIIATGNNHLIGGMAV